MCWNEQSHYGEIHTPEKYYVPATTTGKHNGRPKFRYPVPLASHQSPSAISPMEERSYEPLLFGTVTKSSFAVGSLVKDDPYKVVLVNEDDDRVSALLLTDKTTAMTL